MATQKPKLHNEGFWFSDHRRKLNLTQKEVADSIGVSRAYITQIEMGQRWPSKPTLYALLGSLQVPPAEAIRELKLVPNDEAERVVRFIEMMERLAPALPEKEMREFSEMFAADEDQYRWVGQWALGEPMPAAPAGWLRLNKKDRRLVQDVVTRLINDYPEGADDGDQAQ